MKIGDKFIELESSAEKVIIQLTKYIPEKDSYECIATWPSAEEKWFYLESLNPIGRKEILKSWKKI